MLCMYALIGKNVTLTKILPKMGGSKFPLTMSNSFHKRKLVTSFQFHEFFSKEHTTILPLFCSKTGQNTAQISLTD